MQADMDLVRNILLAIKSEEQPLDNIALRRALERVYTHDLEIPDDLKIVDHIKLMERERLVSVKIVPLVDTDPGFLNLLITQNGRNFLEYLMK